MSTATRMKPKQAKRKNTRRQVAPWAALQDPWALLNASPEKIHEAVATSEEEYHEGQVPSLLQLLGGLRELYCLAAEGQVFSASVPEKVRKRLEQAEQQVGGVLQRFYRVWREGFVAAPDGYKRAWRPAVGYRLEDEAVLAPSVFVTLMEPLSELLTGLLEANASTVFICGWCGRIGPAKQRNKHFCNSTCRVRAFRGKHKAIP